MTMHPKPMKHSNWCYLIQLVARHFLLTRLAMGVIILYSTGETLTVVMNVLTLPLIPRVVRYASLNLDVYAGHGTGFSIGK